MKDLKELETKIGYQFVNTDMLYHAMRHSSYANEQKLPKEESNERLEFLGDAVLELISSEYLFLKFPHMQEGEATRRRASMVCEQSLALCAQDLNIGSFLYLGRGEERTGGRIRPSVTSDALEALIGAIYLDGGFTNAKEFIHRFILDGIEEKQLFYDSKTILQEMVQKEENGTLTYEIIGEEGPDHCKKFTVEVRIDGKTMGQGEGRTKKSAEQAAAYSVIKKLKQ